MATTKFARGWGAWHTGPDVKGPCPQDGQWHTLDQAVALNEKDSVYRQAVAWARHKRWLGA